MVCDLPLNQRLYHRAQQGSQLNKSSECRCIGWAVNLQSPFDEKLFQPAWLLEIISYPAATEIVKLAIDEIKVYRIHCPLSSYWVLQELAQRFSCLLPHTTVEVGRRPVERFGSGDGGRP